MMEFRCGDVCLPASLLCNGVDNCRDRSDEKGCTNTKPTQTKPYIGGSRKDNAGDAGKRRAGGGYADKDDGKLFFFPILIVCTLLVQRIDIVCGDFSSVQRNILYFTVDLTSRLV